MEWSCVQPFWHKNAYPGSAVLRELKQAFSSSELLNWLTWCSHYLISLIDLVPLNSQLLSTFGEKTHCPMTCTYKQRKIQTLVFHILCSSYVASACQEQC